MKVSNDAFYKLIINYNKMKKIFVFVTLFFAFSSVNAQKLDLADKDAVVSFLDGKTFEIGNYGQIEFKFKNFNKDFFMLEFEVELQIKTGKKPQKHKLWTSIPYTNGGFYIPDYFKSFNITEKNTMKTLQYLFPTRFELLSNGELYFVDKTETSFDDYYSATIKNGDLHYGKIKYVLCKQK